MGRLYPHSGKKLPLEQQMYWAKSLKTEGVPSSRIIINGSDQLYQHTSLGGVHWGQSVIRSYDKDELKRDDRLRVGISVHSLEEAKIAEERGADYLFMGTSMLQIVNLIANQEGLVRWLRYAPMFQFR